MASSLDNLDFLDHLLLFPPSFSTADPWFSDAQPNSLFLADDDALSHLLTSLPTPNSNPDTPRSVTISGSGSGSDPDVTNSNRKRAFPPGPVTGRVSKRKSRPSKKSPTTFITADAENFQRMVQQVTGLHHLPGKLSSAAHEVLKPETRRISAAYHASCLPTLDTSAFLLDRNWDGHGGAVTTPPPPPAAGGEEGRRTRLDFDKLVCFPTLDSWTVM